MGYNLPLPLRQNGLPYAAFTNLFTREECGAILALGVSLGPQVATIGAGSVGIVDEKKRVSEIRWINWHQTNNWLFEKLSGAIMHANNNLYGFNLVGMMEPLQLTRYIAPPKGKKKKAAGHYDWHEDHTESGAFQLRKLSVVVQLSDTHKGGRFKLVNNDVPEQGVGNAIIFPSYRTHCVEPVTEGERWSLVGWITGPAFV